LLPFSPDVADDVAIDVKLLFIELALRRHRIILEFSFKLPRKV
jgi:hypothetical protein